MKVQEGERRNFSRLRYLLHPMLSKASTMWGEATRTLLDSPSCWPTASASFIEIAAESENSYHEVRKKLSNLLGHFKLCKASLFEISHTRRQESQSAKSDREQKGERDRKRRVSKVQMKKESFFSVDASVRI